MEMLVIKTKKAFSLVEVLLSVGIFAVFISVIIGILIYVQESTRVNGERLQANLILEESADAILSIRDEDYNALIVGTYGLNYNGGKWILVENHDQVGKYIRSVQITNIDPSIKQISVNVSWESRPNKTSTLSSTFRLTDWTTVGGTGTGGTIAGFGDWCSPNLSVTNVDLPKNGVANTVSAVEGRIISGTGENASGVSLADISVTTNQNPPTATIVGTANGYKTNDVFFDGDYIYIATDTNSSEVVILTVNGYSKVGWFDAPGTDDGMSVFVKGNYGYLLQGNRFRVFDLSSKTGARNMVSSDKILGGTGVDLFVLGNYAYVTVAYGTHEMEIIDISNPSNPTIASSTNIVSGNGRNVYVNSFGTRAYVTTQLSATEKEFHIIDITNKNASTLPLIGSFDLQGMDPKGVRVFPGNVGIVVGTGGKEYQVLDIRNEQNISRCAQVDIDTGINAIDAVFESDNDAFAYVVTSDASSELKIVEGGALSGSGGGGGSGGTGGIYPILILRRT